MEKQRRRIQNVVITSYVKLGKNVNIKPGAVIGGDGYGFERDAEGKLMPKIHRYGVVIEDDAQIGSCTVVDRGEKRDTVIKQGTKIDNLCHIAHDCIIGRHVGITAHVILGGSVEIGDYAFVTGGSNIRPGVKIGAYTLIGLGSLVTKDVPPLEVWYGSPARFVRKNEFWFNRAVGSKNDQEVALAKKRDDKPDIAICGGGG
jgi:UDP-3-O-[3-hydroxymyristoyl] glucosamine N-acyltransferase